MKKELDPSKDTCPACGFRLTFEVIRFGLENGVSNMFHGEAICNACHRRFVSAEGDTIYGVFQQIVETDKIYYPEYDFLHDKYNPSFNLGLKYNNKEKK